jgi:hypothetical protein
MKNIHKENVPKDIIEEAMRKFNEGHDLIRPYLCPLSNEERSTILKMGDKSLAMVEKTSEMATQNPQFCPPYFSVTELNIDLEDAVNLRQVLNRIQQISREVDDTMMLAGHEAFVQSLTFYNALKQATRDNVPGAQPLFDELKKRFALGRPAKKNKTEE